MTLTASATQEIHRLLRHRRRRLIAVLAAMLVVVGGYAVWTNTRAYTLQASIQIAVTPQRVWAILTDLSAYKRRGAGNGAPQWHCLTGRIHLPSC